MEHWRDLLDYVLNLDIYLMGFVNAHGMWTYLLAFAVIFCETGLIITPFLPGDSLLFAMGSLTAHTHSPIHILLLLPLLIMASILGNYVNYKVGRFIGPSIFSVEKSRFFNQKHLQDAHAFYEKHGGKTIILARFIPIIRTFVPFIAGVSYMSPHLFHTYNISSAVLWIGVLLGMGYFLGSLPIIKDHFSIVIYGIIVISLLPPLFTLFYQRFMNPENSNS